MQIALGTSATPALLPSISLTASTARVTHRVLQPSLDCLEKLVKLQHLHLSQSHTENSDCSNKALRALSRLHSYLHLSHNTHLHLQDMLL